MKAIAAAILCLAGFLLDPLMQPVQGADVPPLKTGELVAPWGVVVERWSYYEKDGEQIRHGLTESFSGRGELDFRFRYQHGEPHGLQETFYSGLDAKQSEFSCNQGIDHGPHKTWDIDGNLLFEGSYRNGNEFDGWFSVRSSGGSGVFHDEHSSWTIVEWSNGKKVPASERKVEQTYRSWEPGTLPDMNYFSRWSWSYWIKTDYPFYHKAPSYADVPALIDLVGKKGDHYRVSNDQLVALTRMQFGPPSQQDKDKLGKSIGNWRRWWQEVGQYRTEQRQLRGKRDKKAWDLAQRGRNRPMPETPMVIPEEYTLTVKYSSGDYEGVISETFVIERRADEATLQRQISRKRSGPVQSELWQPFNAAQADTITRTLGYLLDQPWLLNDEATIEKEFWKDEAAQSDPDDEAMPDDPAPEGLTFGRESYHVYYPGVSFELRDAQGKLWWNADPRHWNGANPPRFNQCAQPTGSTVFAFVARSFPESQRHTDGKSSGWQVIEREADKQPR